MTDAESEDLQNRFTYHKASPGGRHRHETLSNLFIRLAGECQCIVPPGRELSLVLTKLEEAKFWASAGVARNPATR